MDYAGLRAKAREQLGGSITNSAWLMAGVVCLIVGAISGLVGSVVPYVGSYIVVGVMSYGMAYVFLNQSRDQQPINISDVFIAFNSDFLEYFLLGLMISLFTALWSLLFVIPGIVKGYAYAMAYYIKVDNPEMGWKECIDESQKMMEGHKMELFVLDLTFIGWIFVGAFTCGIGFFWVAPYINAAHVKFYETIRI